MNHSSSDSGVLKYGVETWVEAKEDKDLELHSKILPTSEDATPQVNFTQL